MSAPKHPVLVHASVLAGLLFSSACSNSNNPPPIGVADDPVVTSESTLQGVVITIEDVRGTGGSGRARVGDLLTVDFKVETEAGQPLELSRFARGAIMVSGPTFNYQRVITSQPDVIDRVVKRALGAYRYTFAVAIPAAYEAPYNDTA